MKRLANFLIFQLGWLATVLGAAYGYPWLSMLALIAAVALHGSLVRAQLAVDLKLIALLLAIGVLWDSLLIAGGWVSYRYELLGGQLPPYWILVLWGLFALTLNHSLGWLQANPVRAALFGAIGGPLSYYAGDRLGALNLLEPAPALLVMALGWALITPLVCRLAALLATRATPPAPGGGD